MRKLFRKITPVLTAALLFCIPVAAYAAEPYEIDTGASCSITVTMQKNDTKEPVGGGNVLLYKVADVERTDQAYIFTYTDDFSGNDDALLTEEALALSDTAEILSAASLNAAYAAAATVPDSGTVVFDGLTVGLYLVRQTVAPEGYEVINPFLITVPMNGDSGLVYDVDATPKTALVAAPEEITPQIPSMDEEEFEPAIDEGEEARHTDDVPVATYVALVAIMATACVYLAAVTENYRKNKEEG